MQKLLRQVCSSLLTIKDHWESFWNGSKQDQSWDFKTEGPFIHWYKYFFPWNHNKNPPQNNKTSQNIYQSLKKKN